jgi:hypothetical protein
VCRDLAAAQAQRRPHLPLGPWQSVPGSLASAIVCWCGERQSRLRAAAPRAWHQGFHESKRRLPGERLLGDTVRLVEVERLHGEQLKTYREGKDPVLDWLFWYNRSRLHPTLKYLSPTQSERQDVTNQQAIAA